MGKFFYLFIGATLIIVGWIMGILVINECLDNPCSREKYLALKGVALNPFPVFLMAGSLLLGAGIYYNHKQEKTS